jgi:hypothetical protein
LLVNGLLILNVVITPNKVYRFNCHYLVRITLSSNSLNGISGLTLSAKPSAILYSLLLYLALLTPVLVRRLVVYAIIVTLGIQSRAGVTINCYFYKFLLIVKNRKCTFSYCFSSVLSGSLTVRNSHFGVPERRRFQHLTIC